MPDQHDEIPTILPNLLPHTEPVEGDQPAEQGLPPADYASRPASGVGVTLGETLSAEQVAQMVGGDGASTDANVALDEAEDITP